MGLKVLEQDWDSLHIVKSNKAPEWLREWFIEIGYLPDEDINYYDNGELKVVMAIKGDGIAYSIIAEISDLKLIDFDYNMDSLKEIREELMVSKSTAQTLDAFNIM